VGRPGQKGRVLACEGGNRRMVRYNHRGRRYLLLRPPLRRPQRHGDGRRGRLLHQPRRRADPCDR
jgi:hypothetical protein